MLTWVTGLNVDLLTWIIGLNVDLLTWIIGLNVDLGNRVECLFSLIANVT